MEFKKFAESKRNKKIAESEKFDLLKEVFERSFVNKETPIEESERIVDDFRPKFLGKLNESPNPQEYKDGTMYKDTRSGIVYIVENGLWESLVEDGKPGAQGRQGAAGSGTGVKEVQQIVNDAVSQIVISGGSLNSIEWSKVTGVPTASSATSGVLSSQDWNSFNDKVNSVSGNYLPTSGGNVTGNLSANNISANSFYFNSTSDKLLSLDSNKKIVSTNVSTSSLNYISAVSADVQAQINFINNAVNVSSGTGFIPAYVNSSPSVSSLQISAGMSQRIALPSGSTIRLTWDGFGPFAYKQGTSSVVANANDSPGRVDNQFIVPVIGTHIAVYGIGSGAVTIEGGYGGLVSVIDSGTVVQGDYLPISGGTVSGAISANSISATTIKPAFLKFATNPISYGNKAVLIGDRLHSYYGNVSGGNQQSESYFSYFQFFNGHRYTVIKNLAEAGSTTSTHVVSAQLNQSLEYNPDVIFTSFGGNDITNGISIVTILQNAKTIFDTILGNGIRCVYVIPAPPYNCTKTEGEKYLQIRNYVYSYRNKFRGLQIFDGYELTIDATSTTSRSVSGYMNGGSPYGVIAKVWGKKFSDIDDNQSTGQHIIAQGDNTSAFPASKNILVNSLCQGSVSATNVGMTGFLPTGYNLIRSGGTSAQTASASIVPRSDGIGNDVEIKFTSTSASDSFVFYFPLVDISGAKPGQKFVLDFNLTISGSSALKSHQNTYYLYLSGVAQQITTFASYSDTSLTLGQSNMSGWVRTNYIEIPVGIQVTSSTIVLYANFDGPGGATYRIGRVSVVDISDNLI